MKNLENRIKRLEGASPDTGIKTIERILYDSPQQVKAHKENPDSFEKSLVSEHTNEHGRTRRVVELKPKDNFD